MKVVKGIEKLFDDFEGKHQTLKSASSRVRLYEENYIKFSALDLINKIIGGQNSVGWCPKSRTFS